MRTTCEVSDVDCKQLVEVLAEGVWASLACKTCAIAENYLLTAMAITNFGVWAPEDAAAIART
jgi:hypothetical protein